MKFLYWALFFALVALYLPNFCYEKTDGFQMSKICSRLPYAEEFATEKEPLVSLDDALKGTFTYLGSGGQSFSFVSEDNQYVIKLFRHTELRVPYLLDLLPLPKPLRDRREEIRSKKQKRFKRDFRSYKLSFETLSKETGLLFIHLNKTDNLNKRITIIDKIGISHSLNLDSFEFVLQRRGELAYLYLDQLVEQGDLELAKKGIEGICELIIARSKKGIYDEDAKIHRNFGFIGNEPFLIDVGRLKIDPKRANPQLIASDLEKITRPFSSHLKELSPSLAEHLEAYLERSNLLTREVK